MRASTAYFAGAGTLIVAIVAGVGGGLLMADVMSPKSPKQGTEMSRLERRMSTEPKAATPSESVPYLAAPAAPVTTVAAAPAQTQTEAVNSASTPAQPVDTSAAGKPEAAASQAVATAPQSVAREQTVASDDAIAKARDPVVKRAEQRKSERRQRWAEKRRQRQQQELRAVEEIVREDTLPNQEFAAEPVRIEMPQIRLFGPD
jgi:hypothetical protein